MPGFAPGSAAIDGPGQPGRLNARFAAGWAAALPAGLDRDARAGLAVSGGPDSLALLLLAHAAFPGRFEVATVDHGLRPESAAEAALVSEVCAAQGIAHATLRVAVDPAGNLQANARAARYTALAAWLRGRGLAVLATAHHADDQAETLLMRLARGSGVRGLAGMRPVSAVPGAADLPLVRPLLGWRRAELARVVQDAGIAPAHDPSNRDERFERVRVRAGLAAAGWLDPAALAASAGHLADADAALAWAVEREWEAGVTALADGFAYVPAAPRAVRLRVLERIIAALGTADPRGSEVSRWLDRLAAGETATLGGVRGAGGEDAWRFTAAPPHRGS